MVFEHVRDAKAAYGAVYNLLKPNGICLAFFPTLYCVPFLANYLSPRESFPEAAAKVCSALGTLNSRRSTAGVGRPRF